MGPLVARSRPKVTDMLSTISVDNLVDVMCPRCSSFGSGMACRDTGHDSALASTGRFQRTRRLAV